MSKKVILWLGRHRTSGSGFWVYLESVLPHLIKLLASEGYSVQLVGAGEPQLQQELESILGDSELTNSFSITWKKDPLQSRVLGHLSDLFFRPSDCDLFHGMSNTVPLRFYSSTTVLTLHDLLQPFPVGRPQSFSLLLRTLYYRIYFGLVLRFFVGAVITGHEKSVSEMHCRYPLTQARNISVVYPPLSELYCEELPESLLVNSQSGQGYLLSFVSSDPRKNFERLLKAYERSEVAESLRVVLGDLSVEKDLRARIAASCRRENILLCLSPNRTELRQLFREARATLFPSLAEGFGYPIYESLSQGRPVMTSPDLVVSALPESEAMVVSCSPTSEQAMRDAIQRVVALETPLARRREISRAVQAALDPKLCAKKVFDSYFSVAKA